ncbi:hypothetical protein [Leptospira santarosai]|uniref:hypothetical protein n=1 Tax=Leptospira santarosai TaxID=28183 RepID=UPI0007745B76|nr:hypothetical protein [Leptospira santarosai]
MLLSEYVPLVKETDKFARKANHIELLLIGLFGEAGGILSELKKFKRDNRVQEEYKEKLIEEIGDFLWYFTRIVTIKYPNVLKVLYDLPEQHLKNQGENFDIFLRFGNQVGDGIAIIKSKKEHEIKNSLVAIFTELLKVTLISNVSLSDAMEYNIKKIFSRWPTTRRYTKLFDEGYPEEDRLPRKITIEFKQTIEKPVPIVLLRGNGLNIGDRISDNIGQADGYRFHDIFHFSYMVHLGWSPVARSLFKCKRKSRPSIDESEDGARAAIIEEAISAMIFSYAKKHAYFLNVSVIEYGLLKSISTMVEGYEVSIVPLWQWEIAILDGFRVFRLLKKYKKGKVLLDLKSHRLSFSQ